MSEFFREKMPKIFWFKYLYDRKQYHYAFILKESGAFSICFVNQYGQIFDRLLYKKYKVAKRLLRKNKFICSSNQKCSYLPQEPLYKKLMYGRKTAPYSKGNLWQCQERYKNNDFNKIWKDYQISAKADWYLWNKYYNFYSLINKAENKRFSRFEVIADRLYDTDIDLTIKTNFGESKIFIASSMNYISNIWKFLDAVIKSSAPRIFFYCDEEGADSFFYVKKYQNELLNFVHITNANTGKYSVLQKITIFQNEFISAFYKAINSAIKNGKYVANNNIDYDNFIELVKGSMIVKTYLKGSG